MNYSLIIFSLLFFYFMYIQFNPLDGTQFKKEKEKEKKTRINYRESEKDIKIRMDAYDKKRQKLASMEDELKNEQSKWFKDNAKIQTIQTEIETLQKSLEEDQKDLDIETDTDENPESETLEENPDSNSELLKTLKKELEQENNYFLYPDNPERIKELEEKIKEIEQKENIGQ